MLTSVWQVWQIYGMPFLRLSGQGMLVLLPLLITLAYVTFIERKVIAAIQLRRGPNRVGPFGLLQPFADGLKLMHKEFLIPQNAQPFLFITAPILTFTVSVGAWGVIPWGDGVVFSDANLGVLYILAMSSLGVYGVILAGWASRSRYALLGAVRAVAQMISYEIALGLSLVPIVLMSGSLNLTTIVNAQKGLWYIVPHLPMAVIFFISALAETKRTPFDLPEAESELVSGYHVEYSSLGFSLLFLSEYASLLLMSTLGAVVFLGGWLAPWPDGICGSVPGVVWMALKVSLVLFMFLWVRATLPRLRYDHLMALGWKLFIPLTLGWIVVTGAVLLWLG
jgi:NADH-quinone oxidoreductase subunit H